MTRKLSQEEKRNRRETLRWMNSMQHKMSQIMFEFASGIQPASEEHEKDMMMMFLLRIKEQSLRDRIYES